MNTVFEQALQSLPLVAILRGIPPDESVAVAQALTQEAWQLLEVPLNSPSPLDSIAAMRQACPQALVGAGTVLTAQAVREVHAADGQLIIAPNFSPEGLRRPAHWACSISQGWPRPARPLQRWKPAPMRSNSFRPK